MEARQPFSRLGWALFAQMAVMLAAQWGVLLLASFFTFFNTVN